MAVAVVRADRDEAQACAQRAVQVRALVGRAVVRDLHDIDGTDAAGREQGVLSLLPEVAEEQRTDPPAVRLERQRARVPGLQVRWRVGGRPQQAPVEGAETAGEAGVPLFDGDACRRERIQCAPIGVAHGSLHDRARRPLRHSCDTAHVIGVEVREQ
jgi:hypothetical protein